MSALGQLPPKAEMRGAARDVRSGPKADIRAGKVKFAGFL